MAVLPNIDLQRVCRASEKEINAVFTDINRDAFAACMNGEKTAQEQLVKDKGREREGEVAYLKNRKAPSQGAIC